MGLVRTLCFTSEMSLGQTTAGTTRRREVFRSRGGKDELDAAGQRKGVVTVLRPRITLLGEIAQLERSLIAARSERRRTEPGLSREG